MGSMDAQPKQPMRPTPVERSAEQHLQMALQKQKGKKVDDCIKMAKTAYDGVVKQLKTLQKKINALDGGESCANKKTAELRRICRCCVLKDTKDVEDVAFAEQKVSVESVVTDTITICVAKKNAAGKSTKDCSTKSFVKKLRSDTYKKLAITRKTLAPGVEGTLCGKKEKEAKEKATKEKAPKEKVDKESKTKEKKTKEGGDKEKYKKEGLTKESKSKEGRVKEQTDKEKASKELKRKETNAKEKKTKYEVDSKESKAKERASKETAVKETKNKEAKTKEKTEKENRKKERLSKVKKEKDGHLQEAGYHKENACSWCRRNPVWQKGK